MRLNVSKKEFFVAVERLSSYEIDHLEFGKLVSETTRGKSDITYKRTARNILTRYLTMPVKEYRCRGFKLSMRLEVPIQLTTIEALEIGINELYRLFNRLGLSNDAYPFQRYSLWTFIDVYGKQRYVLHLLYPLGRDPDFFEVNLNEDYVKRFSTELNPGKKIKRFIEWLSFFPS